MVKTTEQTIVLGTTSEKIIRVDANIVNDGRAIELHIISEVSKQSAKEEEFDRIFPIAEVSKLSLEDEFLQHEPKTREQKRLKQSIESGIKDGLKDFRHPAHDLSVDEAGNFVFDKGVEVVVGYTAEWWDKIVPTLIPKKNSRLGTQKQFDAFLGMIINELIKEHGYSVGEAWEVVCDECCKSERYYNFVYAKKGNDEYTKSRRWFNLATTFKIIKKNRGSGFLCAGGERGALSPLINMHPINLVSYLKFYECVGWIVLDV